MHPFQQLLSEFITSQTPPSPHAQERLPIVQFAPLLRQFLEMLAACWAVFGNTTLSQEPVTPQPARPLGRCGKVLDVAAPTKFPERFFRAQQFGPDRI